MSLKVLGGILGIFVFLSVPFAWGNIPYLLEKKEMLLAKEGSSLDQLTRMPDLEIVISEPIQEPLVVEELSQECADVNAGVKFSCSPLWKMRSVDGGVLVVISSDPEVTLIIGQIDSKIVFLEQLTKEALQNIKQYGEGFRMDRVKVGGHEAVEIKSFANGNPQKRLLDYFLVHKSQLYGILFAVEPQEKWEEYKFLIKKIKDSIQFIN